MNDTKIKTHTAHGNTFYYRKSERGFECSFGKSFEDTWYVQNLDDDVIM